MRRSQTAVVLAVFAAGLVGWAALAWGQPRPIGADPAPLPPPAGVTPLPPLPPLPSANSAGDLSSMPLPAPSAMPAPNPLPAPAAADWSTGPAMKPAAPVAVEHPATESHYRDSEMNLPVGRQNPAVSLEWIGPPTAKIGLPADYSLVVKNTCNIPVQQVLVRARLPQGMNLLNSEPKAVADGGVAVWELGTLQARQERVLQMKMVAEAKGDLTPQAWVTFTGSALMRVTVREPKLIVKITAPERVLVGDTPSFALTVSNPGDGPAEAVKIQAVLSPGLEHARGSRVDYDLGNLSPGESRSVQLVTAARVPGEQLVEVAAQADGGLTSTDRSGVNVIMPKLDLQVLGPALRFLDRKAVYSFKVTNPGDAPASNVTVSDFIPAGFKFVGASDGGRHDFSTRTVSWFVGELGPGQTKEVKLEVQAVNLGEFRHKATVQGARGLKVEQELPTRIEGLSAMLIEVVDTEDPIEVGAETTYEIRITNTGSKTETDIKLVCALPDKMEFKSAQGPVRYAEEGRTVVFEALPRLAPRADAIFRVVTRAMAPGDVRFRAQVTSANLIEPVIEMEATRIYADSPEGR